MDIGLCPGNYYDYDDDMIARQRESEIAEEIPSGCLWEDAAFPIDGRSLYFDPLNPPKGALPQDAIVWYRISLGEVVNCNLPKTLVYDRKSVQISQGAIGNSYFTNCLRMLACEPKYIERLLVSDKNAKKGLYTIKFNKNGKWRYIHIDDRIPCRQSGRVHFCRNMDPNETWAMLVEKAYAKLHGCYEAIVYGLIESCLQDVAPSPHIAVFRSEALSSDEAEEVCDVVWSAVEGAVTDERLICCGRFVADPYCENQTDRMGISLNVLYQVVDVCVANAEATAAIDALEVGLICIRNLQSHPEGRYTGRWGANHRLWQEYPEIARDVGARTSELRLKWDSTTAVARKEYMESDATAGHAYDATAVMLMQMHKEESKGDKGNIKSALDQDLYWVQIEDFVQVFNRTYEVLDLSWDRDMVSRRLKGRWKPGDKRSGSGGPPLESVVANPIASPTKPAGAQNADKGSSRGQNSKLNIHSESEHIEKNVFLSNPMHDFSVSANTCMTVCMYQPDRRWAVSRLGYNCRDLCVRNYADRGNRLSACMQYQVGMGFAIIRRDGMSKRVKTFKKQQLAGSSGHIYFTNVCSNAVNLIPGAYVLVPFTDTPLTAAMEYTVVCNYDPVAVDFEGEDVQESDTNKMPRIQSRMQTLEDIAVDADADNAVTSSSSSSGGGGGESKGIEGSTGQPSAEMLDSDRRRSVDQLSAGRKPTENEKGEPIEGVSSGAFVPFPTPLRADVWEWREDAEELGMTAVYDQVSDLAEFLRALRKDVHKLRVQGSEMEHDQLSITSAGSNDRLVSPDVQTKSQTGKFSSTPTLPTMRKQGSSASVQTATSASASASASASGTLQLKSKGQSGQSKMSFNSMTKKSVIAKSIDKR